MKLLPDPPGSYYPYEPAKESERLKRKYDLTAPRGVAGRNSDNTFIKKMLKWEPDTPLDTGLRATYKWIKTQYLAKKAGKRVVD